MNCTNCGAPMTVGTAFCIRCGAPAAQAPQPAPSAPQGMNFDFSSNAAAPAPMTRRKEYKVLSQKDKWFSGKFDPMVLEQAINSYAQQGWRLVTCATADITGFGTTRQEFIAILERDI